MVSKEASPRKISGWICGCREKKSESTPEFAVDCLVSPTDIKADFGAIIPDDIISLDR